MKLRVEFLAAYKLVRMIFEQIKKFKKSHGCPFGTEFHVFTVFEKKLHFSQATRIAKFFMYIFKPYYGSVDERVGDANTEISSCSSVRKLIYFLLFISEHLVGPCVWVGSSLGNVVLFAASFPPAGDQRQTQPVLTFNTGVSS